jgi:hypothetical protein
METNKLRRNARVAAVVVVALMIFCVSLLATKAHAEDKPVDPPLTCVTVDQAQCRALLTNSWDGRQVVHQLDPVPSCPRDRTAVLQARLDRKNHTLADVRAKVARLRARLGR